MKVFFLLLILGSYFTDVTEDAGLFSPPYGRDCISFDADRDGDMDLFISSSKGGRSSFYENLGDGTFMEITGRTGIDITVGIYRVWNVDINGDDLQDLIILEAVPYASPVFYENLGDAFFQKIPTNLNIPLNEITFLDINGDAKLDIIGARVEKGHSEVIFLEQREPWNFEKMGSLFFEGVVENLVLWNFNEDSFFDLYIVVDGDNHHLLENRGEGRFIDVSKERGISSLNSGKMASLLDYDNDGTLDLLLVGAEEGNIILSFKNGKFKKLKEASLEGYSLNKIYLSDMDMDGDLDILSLNEMGNPVFLLNENGTYSRTDELDYPLENSFSALFTDFDNDNDPDLLIVTDDGPRLFENRVERKEVYKISLRSKEGFLHFGEIEIFSGENLKAFPLEGENLILSHREVYPFDSIRIRWPSGEFETFSGPFGENIFLKEGEGKRVKETGFYYPPNDTILRIYPNPTKSAFTIVYTVKEPSNVEIRVLNSSGQILKILESGFKEKGTYIIGWEGERPGTYLIHLKLGDEIYFKKIVLLQ